MKSYTAQSGDTFASVAKKFNVKDEYYLRTYHNLYCDIEDVMHGEMQAGKEIIIPGEPEYLGNPDYLANSTEETENKEKDYSDEGKDTMDGDDGSKAETSSQEEKEEEAKRQDNSSSEHDGKYFVIPRGKAQCNQGIAFPNFKVTSHQKHYWNDADGQVDYLAVTEEDTTFTPSSQPFGGQCKLQPTSSGYKPCSYAPAGKWQKCYDKVKVMGKSCVTEASELQCVIGGKITIKNHGQQSEITKTHVMNANSQEQQIYNPIVNFDEFKEMLNDDFSDDYE